jgi:solute carrier family 25 oxoglutarate transporter 11
MEGAFPTIVRAMSMNLGMLAPYEECKQRFKKYFGDGYITYISSSFVAGFLAAFLGLPPDNMKTKIQKMKPGADGKLPYKGFFDCARKTFRSEGLLRFWVGFPVFYMRVGIHAMITLLVTDALKYIMLGKK